MSILRPQNEDETLARLYLIDRFNKLLKAFTEDEDRQREWNDYLELAEAQYQCEKICFISGAFAGFVFGIGEGIEFAMKISGTGGEQT